MTASKKNRKLTESRNKPVAEVAKDGDGWHWQLWAGNGQPLARSTVAYTNEKQAIQAVRNVRAAFLETEIIVKGSAG